MLRKAICRGTAPPRRCLRGVAGCRVGQRDRGHPRRRQRRARARRDRRSRRLHGPRGSATRRPPLGRRRRLALQRRRHEPAAAPRARGAHRAGVSNDGITVLPVPGAFELPLAAMALAKTRRYACIVALGAIVRGETPHFDYVAAECASGLQLAGIETGVPVAFGVLTVDNVAQAEARIEKAADAVRSALEMADLFARLRASSPTSAPWRSIMCSCPEFYPTAGRNTLVEPLNCRPLCRRSAPSAGRSRPSAITAHTRWSPPSAGSIRTCSASGYSSTARRSARTSAPAA